MVNYQHDDTEYDIEVQQRPQEGTLDDVVASLSTRDDYDARANNLKVIEEQLRMWIADPREYAETKLLPRYQRLAAALEGDEQAMRILERSWEHIERLVKDSELTAGAAIGAINRSHEVAAQRDAALHELHRLQKAIANRSEGDALVADLMEAIREETREEEADTTYEQVMEEIHDDIIHNIKMLFKLNERHATRLEQVVVSGFVSGGNAQRITDAMLMEIGEFIAAVFERDGIE